MPRKLVRNHGFISVCRLQKWEMLSYSPERVTCGTSQISIILSCEKTKIIYIYISSVYT